VIVVARPPAKRPESLVVQRIIDDPSSSGPSGDSALEDRLMGALRENRSPKPAYCTLAALAH
jgi:hypothetical protein